MRVLAKFVNEIYLVSDKDDISLKQQSFSIQLFARDGGFDVRRGDRKIKIGNRGVRIGQRIVVIVIVNLFHGINIVNHPDIFRRTVVDFAFAEDFYLISDGKVSDIILNKYHARLIRDIIIALLVEADNNADGSYKIQIAVIY